jgi:hypothetical protein
VRGERREQRTERHTSRSPKGGAAKNSGVHLPNTGLPFRAPGVTGVLKGRYMGVTSVLQRFYRGGTRVLQGFYRGVI